VVRGHRAIFQYRENKDTLDCELLEYLGIRETTKVEVKRALRTSRAQVLKQLQGTYPKFAIRSVGVE
jgi:hypothetical protein